MSKKRLYLCGGINGLSDAECREWRKTARHELSNWYDIVDPITHDYRGKDTDHAEEIVQFDINALQTCDTLLVNATRPSWGTAMEVFISARLEKRSVAVIDPGKPMSPWLSYHVGVLVPSWFGAFQVLRGLAKS